MAADRRGGLAYRVAIARAMQVPIADGGGVEFGFLLHDVGKVAIPDASLYKPDKLTDEERALMAQHPVIGAEIVREIAFFTHAVDIVRSHHERWDGTGYPDRLRGEEIPLAARVFTVADVLDALTTDRPYRPASPMQDAREMIRAERGRKLIATTLEDVSQFDLHEASGGVEAVSIARRERPALVFLDVDMPTLNGVDVCRELREHPETGDATIVMLTATRGDNVERRAEDAGADLLLTKPFSPLDLLRLVDRLSGPASP